MQERAFKDTSEFFSIERGDDIEIGSKRYTVTGHERETRFGIDEPKFWVKRVVDTETGRKKIIKLAFLETFEMALSGVRIVCFRNPDKEGRILELVRDQPYFMQGTCLKDTKNNNIRILDIVRGLNFYTYIDSLGMGHETYFHEVLPGILRNLAKAFEAIRFLHVHGFKHGDIRNDHIMVERETGRYVWIDFDYDYKADENPFGLDVFGLGNILLYAIGKGFHGLHMIQQDTTTYGNLRDRLELEDFCLLDKWRLINLKKVYPYIPTPLNHILMHFSSGAEIHYEAVEEVTEDLNRAVYTIFK
jgi:hypothetical protein